MTSSSTSIALEDSSATNAVFLPALAGFFFVFRAATTFLFFQSNPVTGSIVNIAICFLLVYAAGLASAGDLSGSVHRCWSAPPVRWILALLLLSAVSLAWTGAQSRTAAAAYCAGLAAEIAVIPLLLRRSEDGTALDALLQGAVWGAAALAVVAWCAPRTADLRLGSDAFLHPNTLGLAIGLGTLIAQYFASRGAIWKWLAAALAVTLLRTLSKTAIVAFLVAECFYLMQNRQMTRRSKAWLVAAALFVVACFWGLLTAYLDIYNNTGSGNQPETLTGRTVLWAVTLAMGMDKPWLGHGFYSFKSLIPAFGPFEPVHAHNELLQPFFELGIAGVVVVTGIYASFWKTVRRATSSELRTLALSLLIFVLVRGLTDTTSVGLSFPLWLMAALSVAVASPAISEAQPL
jgi:exopolysaccharide production protein ExoQ